MEKPARENPLLNKVRVRKGDPGANSMVESDARAGAGAARPRQSPRRLGDLIRG